VDAMQIQVTDQPAETDWQWLEGTINQFNMRQTGYQDYRPLAIFVRDSSSAIIAGLTAYTWGGTLRILVLWVHQNWQRHGCGTQLQAAEQEALARSCSQAVVGTHSFQAPQFYPKCGYTACGVIADFPLAIRKSSSRNA